MKQLCACIYCYAVSALSNCRDLHVIFVGEYIYSDNSLDSGSVLSLKRATLSSLHKGIMWTSGRAGTMGNGEEHILSREHLLLNGNQLF